MRTPVRGIWSRVMYTLLMNQQEREFLMERLSYCMLHEGLDAGSLKELEELLVRLWDLTTLAEAGE